MFIRALEKLRVYQTKRMTSSRLQLCRSSSGEQSSYHPLFGSEDACMAELRPSFSPLYFYKPRELGHLAESSIVASRGEVVVHAVVCTEKAYKASNASSLGGGVLPMTVDYRTRSYSLGILPDNLLKRDKHGSDEETLVARVIDRCLRPLFPKGYCNTIQVCVTVHSRSSQDDPIVVAVNSASCAMLLSKQPWNGPIGCVRVGLVDEMIVVNPSIEELKRSTLDLLYAGTRDRAVMMEIQGDQIPNGVIRDAIVQAQEAIDGIISAQLKMYGKDLQMNNERREAFLGKVLALPLLAKDIMDVAAADPNNVAMLRNDASIPRKEAKERENSLRLKLLKLSSDGDSTIGLPALSLSPELQDMAANYCMSKIFRGLALQGHRHDGRKEGEMRPIAAHLSVLASSHGSAFFQRGDTHVLASATLGSLEDSVAVKELDGQEVMKTFMLQYDFPPYCTGDVGNYNLSNRRMLGHGNLAEKALRCVTPSMKDFPYLLRAFCECTSSSGSSSMASASAASLALTNAGVPLKSLVAGVSIGVITAEKFNEMTTEEQMTKGIGYRLLTDILGMEDHYGDMDFKIAGTARGITAAQLDVKLSGGMPLFVLFEALVKASDARKSVLAIMSKSVSSSLIRKANPSAKPHAEIVNYNPERKRFLIGPGGEMIRFIEETFDVKVTPLEEGVAYIYGRFAAKVVEARDLVQDIVIEVLEGNKYQAEVAEVKDYGAIVRLSRAQEALLHMSELTHDKTLLRKPLIELLPVGKKLNVQVLNVDKGTGLVKVTRKLLLNPNHPDDLCEPVTLEIQNEKSIVKAIPTFPTTPPKKWNKDFFLTNVAQASGKEDTVIEKLVDRALMDSSMSVTPRKNSDNKSNNNNNNNNHIKQKNKKKSNENEGNFKKRGDFYSSNSRNNTRPDFNSRIINDYDKSKSNRADNQYRDKNSSFENRSYNADDTGKNNTSKVEVGLTVPLEGKHTSNIMTGQRPPNNELSSLFITKIDEMISAATVVETQDIPSSKLNSVVEGKKEKKLKKRSSAQLSSLLSDSTATTGESKDSSPSQAASIAATVGATLNSESNTPVLSEPNKSATRKSRAKKVAEENKANVAESGSTENSIAKRKRIKVEKTVVSDGILPEEKKRRRRKSSEKDGDSVVDT